MRFNELQNGANKGLYDPTSDSINRRYINDTRKEKITLRDLNKLKKIRAFRRLQELKRSDLISVIYGSNGGDF